MVYVKALFFLCFLQTILHSSYQCGEYYGGEDLRGFVYKLRFVNAVDAINLITLPLECRTCPWQTRQLRQHLLSLVNKGRIDIRNIILNLQNFADNNRNDILIRTLMALNEYTNLPVNIRLDISNALFYLLKKRFLQQNNLARNGKINIWNPRRIAVSLVPVVCRSPYSATPVYPDRPRWILASRNLEYPVSSVSHGDSGYAIAIRVILEKLLELEKRWNLHSTSCSSALSPKRIICPRTRSRLILRPRIRPKPFVPNYVRLAFLRRQFLQTIQQLRMRMQRLIQLIPAPIYPKEKIMYKKLKSLLQSSLVLNLLKSLNLKHYRTDTELFNVIITTILKTVRTEEIREVVTFWKNYQEVKQGHFNFVLLLDQLPRPTNLKEQWYYNIMHQLFTSKFLYQTVHSSVFYHTTDLSQKLIILLNELVHSRSVSSQILEAVKYYLVLIESKQTSQAFGNLVNVLPAPKNQMEIQNFNLLKQLLNSHRLFDLVQNLKTVNLTTVEKLTYILKTIITRTEYHEYRSVAIYYRDAIATQKHGFSYFNLLNLLPQTEENRIYRQTITEYFYSAEFETILSSLQISKLSATDKLIQILQAIQKKSSSTVVVQAAAYFLQQIEIQGFYKIMNSIISILPRPKEANEIAKYNIVKTFLLSQQSYKLLTQIDFSIFPTTRLLLDFVLKTIVESNVEATIKDAAEYYIDLYERLQSIELFTKKEIKKKFKLTEIFLDTLNPSTLTLSQKDAFKKFFTYISQIKPTVMEHFDSWDEAHTRGQFMKLLFKYLLEQPETHPEIKSCIRILNSLVIMNGKGALPP